MPTTDEQISAMRDMCEALKESPSISAAHVDDWGRHGNFQIMVKPASADRHSTRRVQAAIRKVLPDGAVLRHVFSPDPVIKVSVLSGRRRVAG